jgi:pimeloyl-ACP methyl ester carboxylesterase
MGATVNLTEYDGNRRLADTASGPVGYVDVGTGRPALFVHGVGTSGLLWRNVIGALKEERRCIAVDLPLHGRTPVQPGQDLSLTGLARVVEDFCAALDLSDVDLVANDTGGAVAQIVAAHQPQRLASFTLTNCETLGNVPPWAFKPAVLAARARTGPRTTPAPARPKTPLSTVTARQPWPAIPARSRRRRRRTPGHRAAAAPPGPDRCPRQ